MSTFDGVVAEFPDIRIDYFRQSSSKEQRPPLAYFLSHVHSDHLQGLESCKGIFIWCSPATREILLRLEKYPHRMNFAKGILESRQKTYKHLQKLLRPIPLDTPTDIELVPGRSIRVTLLDANHCVGACMFLIEGDGKAILYTGDIRAEAWWVDALARNPVMVPYARHGNAMPLKQLDTIYLDTTFANKSDRYRRFPSKAEGVSELLQQVAQYPRETEFYIDAWTFGYEDVWQALSTFLRSQIHVDDYRYGLYKALFDGPEPKAPEAYKLIRANIGNEEREGCLSTRYRRLHSCERGTGCAIFTKDFVRITPIISRHNGMEMAELGAGGGHGDLNQQHELEMEDPDTFQKLMSLCVEKLHGQPQLLSSVVQMLTKATGPNRSAISLELADLSVEASALAASQGIDDDTIETMDELPLERLVSLLAKRVTKFKSTSSTARTDAEICPENSLPKHITFPYSRHASYGELCILVEALMPNNIHPCTVDKGNWAPEHSMSYLFGHIYPAPPTFRHDSAMLQLYNEKNEENEDAQSIAAQTQFQDMETQMSASAASQVQQHSIQAPIPAKLPCVLRKTRKHTSDHDQFIEPKRIKRLPEGGHLGIDPFSPSRGRSDVEGSRQLHIRCFPSEASGNDILHSSSLTTSVTDECRAPRKLFQQHIATSSIEQTSEDLLDLTKNPNRCPGVTEADDMPGAGRAVPYGRHSRQGSADHYQRNVPGRYKAAGSSLNTTEAFTAEKELDVSAAAMLQSHLTTSHHRGVVPSRTSNRLTRPSRHSLEEADGYGRLSPRPLNSDELKEALQRHAYDAVLNDAKEWSLVSVNGHGVKEEEL